MMALQIALSLVVSCCFIGLVISSDEDSVKPEYRKNSTSRGARRPSGCATNGLQNGFGNTNFGVNGQNNGFKNAGCGSSGNGNGNFNRALFSSSLRALLDSRGFNSNGMLDNVATKSKEDNKEGGQRRTVFTNVGDDMPTNVKEEADVTGSGRGPTSTMQPEGDASNAVPPHIGGGGASTTSPPFLGDPRSSLCKTNKTGSSQWWGGLRYVWCGFNRNTIGNYKGKDYSIDLNLGKVSHRQGRVKETVETTTEYSHY